MRMLRVAVVLSVALGIAGFLLVRWATPDTAPRSLVFLGGPIVTMSEPSAVQALWIHEGRIEALGSAADVKSSAGPDVEVVRPRTLRDKVRRLLREAQAIYE